MRLLLTATAVAAMAVAFPAAAEPIRVTISHSSPPTSHFGVAAATFEKVVEELSGGRYDVVTQRLDNEREAMESAQFGGLEFALGSSGPAGNFVPEVRVFDVPFIFRDYAHARGVLDSEIGQEILAKFEAAGMIGMAFGENGFRHLTTSKAVVDSPDDVKGLKIRTMENKVHMTAWAAAGVLPTPMAFSELPTALQQGVVDGQENPVAIILNNNFDQLQKNLYLTAHVYSPGLLVGSPDFLNALTPEDRAIFDEAAKAAVASNRSEVEKAERDGIDELRRRGMSIIDVDRESFRAAMSAADGEFESQFGSDLLQRIRDWNG